MCFDQIHTLSLLFNDSSIATIFPPNFICVCSLSLLLFLPALFLNLFSSFRGHLQQNSVFWTQQGYCIYKLTASVTSCTRLHNVYPAKTLVWWWRSSQNATLSWEWKLVASENGRIHFWSGCGSRKVICTPKSWLFPLNMFVSSPCLHPLAPWLNILRETSLNFRNQKKMKIMLTQVLQLGAVWVGHSLHLDLQLALAFFTYLHRVKRRLILRSP